MFIITLQYFLCCLSAIAQQPSKKHITEANYDRWGTLFTKSLSASGKWISYEIDYKNKQDTLFVQSTNGHKTYTIPAGTAGRFSTDTHFVCMLQGAKIQLLDLASGAIKIIPNVLRYELAAQGKSIISANKWYKNKSTIKIYDEKANLIDSLVGVTEYKLNQKADAMVFVANSHERYEIGMINFQKYEKQVLIKNSPTKFHQLVWQKNGSSFAYLTEVDSVAKTQVANFYNLDKRLHYIFDKFKDSSKVISSRIPMVISEDGKFITVGLSKRHNTILKKNAVEIWNGNDKIFFSGVQSSNSSGGPITLFRWRPESGEFKQISSDSLPKAMINEDMSYALISNNDTYSNLSFYHLRIDYYIKSIQSGREQLFIKNVSSDPERVSFSPKGDMIIYFHENNWWVYDILREKRLNLTKDIATVSWDNENSAVEGVPTSFRVYGIAGWVNDQKSVLLYDKFDMWLVAIDGSSYKRLTKGREKQMVFRIANTEFHDLNGNYLGWSNVSLNLSRGILLNVRSQNDWSSGFALYRRDEGVRSILFGPMKYDEVKRAHLGFIYTSQKFDVSPQLFFKGEGDVSPRLLYQSNKHQQDFEYGKSSLIKYKNSYGDTLKAAIFYPTGYDSSRKYPMVVEIYEGLSGSLHNYDNPSLLNYVGFNSTNFTLNGYIVLKPDIKYSLGNPGISATKCIVAAVEAVLAMDIVISNKIGLIGHSFGGYETNYILSQTGLFAAGVSGAGISDAIGHYFNFDENYYFRPDMWRFEDQQFRMGKSLYDDKEGYLRNSPIMNADKINTPLLLWSGKQDKVVPVVQSLTMYLALRRLGKKTIFLAYPNEDHNIKLPANQTDLSRRVASWFDYYLKDEKSANWITNGTN